MKKEKENKIEGVFFFEEMDLLTATKENNIEVVKALLKDNVSTEITSAALLVAAYSNFLHCGELLLNAKANTQSCDEFRWTPLHCTSHGGSFNFMRLLLQHKADVNALTYHNCTPLFLACRYAPVDCIKLLIEHGAWRTVNITTKVGDTPLCCCLLRKSQDCAEILLDIGAKMENIPIHVFRPAWFPLIVSKRKKAKRSTLIFKGILMKRLKVKDQSNAHIHGRIPHDMIKLLGLYLWDTRFNTKWE